MSLDDVLDYLGEPYVVGPVVALALIGLTVVGYDLRRAAPGRWRWRWLAAWTVPAATTAVILAALVEVGLSGAGELASILSLFAALMGNFGQWMLILRAAGKPAAPSAGASP